MPDVERISEFDIEDLAIFYKHYTGKEVNLSEVRENFLKLQGNKDYIILAAKEYNVVIGFLSGIIYRDIMGINRPFLIIDTIMTKKENNEIKRQTVPCDTTVCRELTRCVEKIARDNNCSYIAYTSWIEYRRYL